MRRGKKNQGAALLSVIVVMTIVMALGAVVMTIAYVNFSMKHVNKRSKDNFYTAETAMDEICAGLQGMISTAYSDAYTGIMEEYSSYSSTADMTTDFNRDFILNMVDALEYVDATSGTVDRSKYTVSILQGFVSDPLAQVTTSGVAAMNTLTDGLVLKDIQVSYTSADNYETTITTDIIISTPNAEFSMISGMPEIADYSMIANSGLTVNASAAVKLKGKAFAGIDTTAGDGNSITLNSGASLQMDGTDYELLISEGILSIGNAAEVTTGTNTDLWTQSITLADEAELTTQFRTYVKDDTTVEGDQTVVTLGGHYYGYGNTANSAAGTAADSSAIIINGKDTTLDMSSLKTLVVAGSAYVSTSSAAISDSDSGKKLSGNETNGDVIMGDSIAVKSNQVAYLVPKACEGLVSNPMTYKQYEELIEDSDWESKVLNSYVSTLGETLSQAGVIGVKEVFTSKYGGTVYLYMEFADSTAASHYFMTYIDSSANASRLEGYMKNYLKTVKFNTSSVEGENLSRIVTGGSYLVPGAYDSESNSYQPVYTGATSSSGNITMETSNYANTFLAMCRKLSTNIDALTSEELQTGRTVYTNLIDETKLQAFFDAYDNGTSVEGVTKSGNAYTITATGSSSQVILVNNEHGSAYQISASGSGMIIATGDVHLMSGAEWTGVIITKGKVVVYNGTETNPSKLTSNSVITGTALKMNCVIDGVTYNMNGFFKGVADTGSTGGSSSTGSTIDSIRSSISYENWKTE